MEQQMENKKKKGRGIFGFIGRSLRLQVLIPSVILIFLTGGIISFVSYHSSVDITTEELTESVESQMINMSDTFEIYFLNIESILNRFTASDLLIHADEEADEVVRSFAETVDHTPMMTNLFAGLDDGTLLLYPKADLEAGYDARTMDWYKEASEQKDEIIWTEPYYVASTDETVVTAAKSIYDGDDFVGVVGVDVDVTILTSIVNSLEIGESGFSVIFDEDGKLVAHPDEAQIGADESATDHFQAMTSGAKSGIIEYGDKRDKQYMAYAKNPKSNWIIGGIVYQEDLAKEARAVIVPIGITLAIVTLLAFLVSWNTASQITKSIRLVMERMQSIAKGNLSEEPLAVQYENEIGQLIHATNDMSDNMRQILQEITRVSEVVSEHSNQLTLSSNEVQLGTEQVSSTMEELASGSEIQANHTGDLSQAMQVFSEEVDNISENNKDVQSFSQGMLDMTSDGRELMGMSREQMIKIDEIVSDSVEKVVALGTQTQEISKLVDVIQSISEQTNLLALNAAIEASRAGEYGKGFAVVADEVRKLAEEVALSVTDITHIVTDIQAESTVVTDTLQRGYEEVESGTNQIEQTEEKFTEINQALEDMAARLSETMRISAAINERSQSLNKSIEEIAAVSEEAAAGIEQTSASTEETSAAMEEVSESSQHLAQLVEELNELVSRFQL